MKPPALDARLLTAARLFPACDTGADIGADHGKLSCYLLESNQCARMIVADVSADALSKAKALLDRHGLSSRARFVAADGLDALSGETQAIAICGMGGKTAADILLRGAEKLSGAALILCVNTELPLLRRAIYDIGYHLTDERAVTAGARRYVVMRAEIGESALSEKEAFLGPVLMEQTNDEALDYYLWRRDVTLCEKSAGRDERLAWLLEAIAHARDGKDGIRLD